MGVHVLAKRSRLLAVVLAVVVPLSLMPAGLSYALELPVGGGESETQESSSHDARENSESLDAGKDFESPDESKNSEGSDSGIVGEGSSGDDAADGPDGRETGEDLSGDEAAESQNGIEAAESLRGTELVANDWISLKTMVESATGSVAILVANDCTALGAIIVPSGTSVEIKSASDTKTITAQGSFRIFEAASAKLTLENIVLDGNGLGRGVTLSSDASLMLGDGAVIRNCAGKNGGDSSGPVVYAQDSSMVIQDAVLEGSVVGQLGSGAGGAVFASNSTIDMKGGTIRNNRALYGAGLYVSGAGSQLTMDGGSIEANDASDTNYPRPRGSENIGYGGGVLVTSGARFVMNGGSVQGNECNYSGGGVFVGSYGDDPTIPDASSFVINGGAIKGNFSHYAGGGILIRGFGPTMTMYGGEITDNEAATYEYSDGTKGGGYGVGIYVLSGAVTIGDPIGNAPSTPLISRNKATGENSQGGALYAISYANQPGIGGPSAPVVINDADISYNTLVVSGGGISLYDSEVTMNGGRIRENATEGFGGGICLYPFGTGSFRPSFTLNAGSVEGNQAHASSLGGGGVFAVGASESATAEVNLNGGEVSGNASAGHGGGVYVGENTLLRAEGAALIADNEAAFEGGGVYTADFNGFAAGEPVGDYGAVTQADYGNLNFDASVRFEGNTASHPFMPPVFSSDMTKIAYATSSLRSDGAYLHPLNNYDINYRGDEITKYRVVYHPNGGEGTLRTYEHYRGELHDVRANEGDVGFARPMHEFSGWSLDPAAEGGTLFGGEQLSEADATESSVTLYAIWKQEEAPIPDPDPDPDPTVPPEDPTPTPKPSYGTSFPAKLAAAGDGLSVAVLAAGVGVILAGGALLLAVHRSREKR